MKLTNPFWKDVLSSYHFAKPYTKMNTNELLSLDILNFVPVTDLNYYIRWIEHNVQYLCDLIDPHSGNFYTFEQIRNKLNTNNFLKYYSLVSNVPKYIKDHLKENCVNVNFDILSKKDAYLERIVHSKNVRFVYKGLVNAIISLPTEKFSKWEKLLNCEITNWSKYFIILKKSCRNSYLQNFQFKLLHRIIPTNSFLHKIKLKNTNLCTFCKIHDETIEHLFFDCPVTQIFLKSLSKQLKQYYKSSPSNYRPISLLSCIGKVMERAVYKYTYNFIFEHSLLYAYQSGFIRGHSTVYQLLEMYHRVCQNLDERLSTILIFCDISKAFDRVWHEGLIKKLKSYGISGDLLIWFKNYLSGRRQFVFVNNELSDSGLVKAGVPQGSVLGPLLFLLYINDITDNLGNLARLFADDTSLSYSGKNFDLMQIEINNDLQILDQWAKNMACIL